MTLTPGSMEKITWSFTDDKKGFSHRHLIFTTSGGRRRVGLAKIVGDGVPQILTTSSEVAVEKPATLVLKNVNLTYDGTYDFHCHLVLVLLRWSFILQASFYYINFKLGF